MANVLITGAGSGFGKLTAQTLAKRGHSVAAAMRAVNGRNENAARELREWATREGVKLHVVELDVTDDRSTDEGVKAAIAAIGPLDAVVNNAGLGGFGLCETLTPDQLRAMFEVNVVGAHRVNRAVLPAMRARGQGLLVHISSTLGRFVMPVLGLYGATKFALESLAEGYRYELAPTGVESVIVQPGAFPTEFGAKGVVGQDEARAAGYGPVAALPQQMMGAMAGMFQAPNAPNPQEVADAVAKLIETPVGKRPARTVVDRFTGQGTEAINQVAANVQAGGLEAMGMKHLLTPTSR